MNSYKLSALSFLAGATLAAVVLAPTIRRYARVEKLEKQAAEDPAESKLACWQKEKQLHNLLGRYEKAVLDLQFQLDLEHQLEQLSKSYSNCF